MIRLFALAIAYTCLPGVDDESFKGLMHANIQDVFHEHGVQNVSPHRPGDPARPQLVSKAECHAAPARMPDA